MYGTRSGEFSLEEKDTFEMKMREIAKTYVKKMNDILKKDGIEEALMMDEPFLLQNELCIPLKNRQSRHMEKSLTDNGFFNEHVYYTIQDASKGSRSYIMNSDIIIFVHFDDNKELFKKLFKEQEKPEEDAAITTIKTQVQNAIHLLEEIDTCKSETEKEELRRNALMQLYDLLGSV